MTDSKKAKGEDEGLSESASEGEEQSKFSYCSLPEVPERVFGPDVSPARASAILVTSNKWVNGTKLHYYFFDKDTDGKYVYFSNGTREWRSWEGAEDQKRVARQAFDHWKDLGLGLEFEEVDSRDDAEIRIGFMGGDGSWSFIGTYVLNIGPNERTLNFGWDLTKADGFDTALHEIGHTLGLPHEHQNPHAGIVWNEEAVYTALARPPNRWPRDKTHHNIIRKIDPDTVQGSNWDPDSIMHYPFEAGLIKLPAQYRNGLTPDPELSGRDKEWVKSFYPALDGEDHPELKPFRPEPLSILPGEQKNFVIQPDATKYYNIRTFGVSDTIMVLFEDENGELRYRTADDDSGTDFNASIRIKLIKGHRYVLRVRLYYSDQSGETVVMMW